MSNKIFSLDFVQNRVSRSLVVLCSFIWD